MSKKGSVYLIHFERRFGHAQHYRGYTKLPVEERMKEHRNGTGARIMQVVNDAGIPWVLARVWKRKGRKFERNLKSKATITLCPICKSIDLLQGVEKLETLLGVDCEKVSHNERE